MNDDILDKITGLFNQQRDQFNERFDKLVALVFEHYNHVNKKIDKLEEKVDQSTDNVLTRVDGVFKELVTIRQELVMHSGGQRRNGETLEDHEKRIKKLETQRASL